MPGSSPPGEDRKDSPEPKPAQTEITQLLADWQKGIPEAGERLLELLYDDLRKLAQSVINLHRREQGVDTSTLIQEATLRLIKSVNDGKLQIEADEVLLAYLRKTMRNFLISEIRRRLAARHGDGAKHLPLDEALLITDERGRELIALDDALEALAQSDPRAACIVELRYFQGLTIEETAQKMGISLSAVKRGWEAARQWLYQEIKRS